jgi:hypothetical protein
MVNFVLFLFLFREVPNYTFDVFVRLSVCLSVIFT